MITWAKLKGQFVWKTTQKNKKNSNEKILRISKRKPILPSTDGGKELVSQNSFEFVKKNINSWSYRSTSKGAVVVEKFSNTISDFLRNFVQEERNADRKDDKNSNTKKNSILSSTKMTAIQASLEKWFKCLHKHFLSKKD